MYSSRHSSFAQPLSSQSQRNANLINKAVWVIWNNSLTGKVPLAVLDEEVPGQEEDGQGQEEEEAVVCEAVDDAEDVAAVPGVRDDLVVQCEGHAQARQQDVADREVDQEVVAAEGRERLDVMYGEFVSQQRRINSTFFFNYACYLLKNINLNVFSNLR